MSDTGDPARKRFSFARLFARADRKLAPAGSEGALAVREPGNKLVQAVAAGGHWRGRVSAIRLSPRIPIFWLILFLGVLAPSAATIIYFTWIASDQYQAEVRFAIRSSPGERSRENSPKAAASTTNAVAVPQLASQDAHVVAHFLRSRAAIERLEKIVDIKAIFQRPGADFYARLARDPSAEELEDYWKTMVRTAVDGPSGIVTANVRAFNPHDALAIARGFVTISEVLVNEMSERARKDSLDRAEGEVRRTEAQVRDALVALRVLRDQEGFLDPMAAANSTSKLLLETMSERIKLQGDLYAAARTMSEDAPSIQAMKRRLEGMNDQIEKLRAQLTDRGEGGDKTVSGAIARFEEYDLKRIFAERMHTLAQNALERARHNLEQKQLYVSVFLPPFLPEEARFPERLAMSAIIPAALFICWGIFALGFAAVRDHLG